MTLFIDPNVGHTPFHTRSERADHMMKFFRDAHIDARLLKLEFGDVAFEGCGPRGPVLVGIELKTVGGLLGDLTTGRFAGHQVPGMQKEYQYRYLVVEGPVRPANDGMLEVPRGGGIWWSPSPRMMYIDYLKYIDDVRLRGGFHVWPTGNKLETMAFIGATYRGWQKKWEDHKALKVFNEAQDVGIVHLAPPSLTRLWARDLPGIGFEKSEGFDRKFKTPLQLAHGTEADFRGIAGVGKMLAERAWMAIRGLKG